MLFILSLDELNDFRTLQWCSKFCKYSNKTIVWLTNVLLVILVVAEYMCVNVLFTYTIHTGIYCMYIKTMADKNVILQTGQIHSLYKLHILFPCQQ